MRHIELPVTVCFSNSLLEIEDVSCMAGKTSLSLVVFLGRFGNSHDHQVFFLSYLFGRHYLKRADSKSPNP